MQPDQNRNIYANPNGRGHIIGFVRCTKGGFFRGYSYAKGIGSGPYSAESEAERFVRDTYAASIWAEPDIMYDSKTVAMHLTKSELSELTADFVQYTENEIEVRGHTTPAQLAEIWEQFRRFEQS